MTVGGLVILDHRTWSSNIRLQGTWRKRHVPEAGR